MRLSLLAPIFLSLRLVSSHAAIFCYSMYGFNVTDTTFPYDNRPVTPLVDYTFDQWWFHNHLGYPPHPTDVTEFSAGGVATMEIACTKSATTYWASSDGGNIQDPNNPNDVCPGSPTSQYHTTGLSDVKGCGLGIAYKSNVSDVVPEDFTIFTVNQTCVWNRFTDFAVPERMPPCPDNMCICAFFWIHSPDSGSEQMYMNGFQCTITNSTSTVGLATPQLARRCGADPANGKPNADPGNCTYGAKQPFYWLQAEQNNMYEGYYSPPFYNDLYNFLDGAQNDIFQDSYLSMPVPGPNQTALPVLNTLISTASSASVPTLSTPTSVMLPSAVPSGSSGASYSSTAASTLSVPASLFNVALLSATPSSSPGVSDGSTTAPTLSVPASFVSVASSPATPSNSQGVSDGSTTPALSASVNIVSPSAAPSSSPDSQCNNPSKRSDSAFSRRHVPAQRGIKSFTHKKLGRHH